MSTFDNEYEDDLPIDEDILQHYGVAKRSGRYPWGSGGDPYQHSGDFLSRVDTLKKAGLKETEIARDMGFIDPRTGKTQTTKLRTQISLAKDERRALDVATARGLREKGHSLNDIAKKMGFENDSSVRSLLDENSENRMNQARKTADFLKSKIDEKGMVDVGTGVEKELNVSKEKLNQALYILELEGYPVYGGGVPQITNKGKQTNIKVACPPGTEHKDIYDFDKINSVREYTTHDDGENFDKYVYPKSMDSRRVFVRYAEEGGLQRDGLVELRRNVPDISLGNSAYAQVRVLVDNDKYIKGMAVYSDKIPDGYDMVFNSNKPKGTPLGSVLKDIKDDPENPFGSLIKKNGQSYYTDENGKRQMSVINKRAEEGDWDDWSNTLSAQFLAKQSRSLIKRQLNLAILDKQTEFDEICALTNPTVKKALLKSFSDDCDSAAVHLRAASLPRQKYHVILPVPSLKDDEVYAPQYKNGEQVALVRFPHGGTFEIPILTVNNKHADSKKMIGATASDAICINKKVADRLSGADFDGDCVAVIPTGGKVNIVSTPKLKGLEDFDSKMSYGPDKVKADANGDKHYYRGDREYKIMRNTETEMGKVSNLITDMTLKAATQDELARAVRHSMVVIDAAKHKLDYKQSEQDNQISQLKKIYQGSYDKDGRYHEGSATLISRAKSEVPVLKRKGSPKINDKSKPWYDPTRPEGALLWTSVKEEYVDKKTGKVKIRTQQSTKMAEVDDARELSSGTPQEEAYAEYANRMKALGNSARKELLSTGKIQYDPKAKEVYKKEHDTLTANLNVALKNAPRERQAQIMANVSVNAKVQANPDMTRGEVKKESQRALVNSRNSVGAKRQLIEITDRQWEAIQAGAITENKLMQILNNTDIDKIRQRATPRTTSTISQAKMNHMRTLEASGYTLAEIANKLGVSTTAVSKYLKEKE